MNNPVEESPSLVCANDAQETLWDAAAANRGPRSMKLPRGNEMLGVIYGFIAAAVSGLVWYLVVTATNRQVVYLALAMGGIVGKAVSFGSGRGEGRQRMLLGDDRGRRHVRRVLLH